MKSIHSGAIRASEERDVNLDEPIHNGKWTFVKSERVKVDEGDEGEKRMTKLVVSTTIVDVDDYFERRYAIRVNDEGSIIYASSPLVPQFLIQKYKELHHSKDPETIAGLSTYATNFAKYPEERKMEIIAYHMPSGTTVTTNYFNRKRDVAVDNDGLFSTHLKVSTIPKLIPNGNNHIQSCVSVAFVELAITETITETKPENIVEDLKNNFFNGCTIKGMSMDM
jgi:hypothetical protein